MVLFILNHCSALEWLWWYDTLCLLGWSRGYPTLPPTPLPLLPPQTTVGIFWEGQEDRLPPWPLPLPSHLPPSSVQLSSRKRTVTGTRHSITPGQGGESKTKWREAKLNKVQLSIAALLTLSLLTSPLCIVGLFAKTEKYVLANQAICPVRQNRLNILINRAI